MKCVLCESNSPEIRFKRDDSRLGKREYLKCFDCGIIFMSSDGLLSPEEEKARYDTHQNDSNDEGYRTFLRQLTDPLSKRLPEKVHGLDFGCGPGPTISHLLGEKGFKVDNYDPFYYPNDDLLQKEYDFITCSETIEHFSRPRKEFLLFDHLLKTNIGFIGLMTQMLDSDEKFNDWWYKNDPTHVSFYQKQTFHWLSDWMGWKLEFPSKNVVIFSRS